jgi:polysaccharide deacetylase family protein (PEP-CTERM system associated)
MEEFETDVKRSLSILTSIIHQPILGYRAPYFSVTKDSLWALAILEKLGLSYDSSIFPILNHRYGIPSAPRLPHRTGVGLIEVPLSTYPFGKINFACFGGVYFRFFSYRFIRALHNRLNRRGEPILYYLHPWEVDAHQPRISLPLGLRLRHYWRPDRTVTKLCRLLEDFQFCSIKEFLNL